MDSLVLDDWDFMSRAVLKPVRLAPLHVLVVEDDLWLKPVLTETLRLLDPRAKVDWRITVDQIADENGGNWHSLNGYQLIIADIHLPGQRSGLDLWTSCRLSCPRTTFIVMSAMTRAQYLESFQEQGTPPLFLPKPFAPAFCLELVRKALEL